MPVLAQPRPGAVTVWALTDARGVVHPLTGPGPWVVGRGVDADVRIADDPYCARRQCEFKLFEDALAIRPLSDKTPVSVDGATLTRPKMLAEGAVVAFGQTKLRLGRQAAGGGAGDKVERISSSGEHTYTSQANIETVIGRMPGAGGVVVDHPAASRRHAAFWRRDERLWLRDLGSFNGTFVNGTRLAEATALGEGDIVSIGPVQLAVRGAELVLSRKAAAAAAAICAEGVAVDVGAGAQRRRILQPCSLDIGRGEFVALIGGSGAGKSTLMNVLAGRRAPSAGRVEIHRLDVVAQFDALKSFVAYVPQREALHGLLTVRQALGYIAELRLPLDTTAAERAAKIIDAAEAVDLRQHLDTPFARLSGGQKKRACLAAEILCEPDVMFLDEITSGLDEETDFEIMSLLRRLCDERRMTIVCVTHTLANVPQFCDRVVIMAPGGWLVFDGPPAEALAHFQIEALGGVFRVVTADNASSMARRRPAGEGMEPASMPAGSAAGRASPTQAVARLANQFAVLIRRNLRLLIADRATLGLVVVQALAIGLFVGWAFSPETTGDVAVAARNKTLIALLVMSVFWMGCSGASKDIIGESQILRREKAVNLSLGAYLASRLVVGAGFALAQAGLALGVIALFLGGLPGDTGAQLVVLALCAVVAVAMGLLISAAVQSPQEATAMVPIALVPQLILIGTIVPHMPDVLDHIAAVVAPTNVLNGAMLAVYARTLPHGTIPDMPHLPDLHPQVMTLKPLGHEMTVALAQLAVIIAAGWGALAWRYRQGTDG